MQKQKIVYSMRVYLKLVEQGFNPVATTNNPKNQSLICWIFDATPEFLVALDAIIEEG